jgi:HEAT repeat protein
MKTRISTGFWLLATGFCLVLPGCAQIEGTGSALRNAFDIVTRDTALKSARAMEDERFPDRRRIGINKLVSRSYGKHDPYTKRYSQIARMDDDFLVRATAIRAMNRARYQAGTPTFIEALQKDEDARVRLEAAKALANIPDPAAADVLVKAVTNPAEDRDVRIAAADALQHYKKLDVARALATQLRGTNDFGVAWQSRQSLQQLTGRDLKYDEAAWVAYLTGPSKPLG